MTRYRELVELRTRIVALLATMEKVAGEAPDFVRRFDRAEMRDTPSFKDLYFGLDKLHAIAADEADAIQRAGQ